MLSRTATSTFVDNALEKLGEAAWKAALGSVSDYSGLLLGPLGAVGGDLAAEALGLLFNSPKAPAPKAQDVLVIRDFDPREDVIFLPLDATKSLFAQPAFFSSSAANQNNGSEPYIQLSDLQGWGISFGTVDTQTNAETQYAQVFLSQDYLDSLGIDNGSSSAAAMAALQNLLGTAVTIGPGGLPDSTAAYAFSGIEQSDQPEWQVPTGHQDHGLRRPRADDHHRRGRSRLDGSGGTNFGDIITANAKILAPEDVLNNSAVTNQDFAPVRLRRQRFPLRRQRRRTAFSAATATIASMRSARRLRQHQRQRQYNGLHGDAGDDTLVAGSGTSAMDGGDGYNTVSYELSPNGDHRRPVDAARFQRRQDAQFYRSGAGFSRRHLHRTCHRRIMSTTSSHYDILANIRGCHRIGP